ncbi:uncharacterized protein PAC_17974 [Phialocephala subalpina]|uniref:Uncharacterized protein n=1 Tax=Phialocephala subalpina TaxID=576137 RepID=A0A1L7XSS3_9HELO|nr:uncharacterized protein PAC_17974 [Phialocephala subalpina]
MAELVGIIASGISIGNLVAQIGSSIATLKSYWDEIKDAPEEVNSLLEDIEDLHIILDDIKDDQNRNPVSPLLLGSTSMAICLTHCRRAADQLKELVDELGADINAPGRFSRKHTALKVVLKRKKVERYKNKVERAVRLLNLSLLSYTSWELTLPRSLIQLQPEIIVARLSRTTKSSEAITPTDSFKNCKIVSNSVNGSHDYAVSSTIVIGSKDASIFSYFFGSISFEKRRVIPVKNCKENAHSQVEEDRHEISAYFRAPAWLINRAWEAEGRRARSGWNFNILTYNILSSKDALVFGYAQNGPLSKLQDLFKERLASPFDTDEYGHTLLHHSARRGRFKICKFLLDEGAKRHAPDGRHITPLGLFAHEGFTLTAAQGDIKGAFDMIRLLMSGADLDIGFFRRFAGPEEAFILLQQQSNPQYYSNSLDDRASVAQHLIYTPFSTPGLFRIALSKELGDVNSYKYRDAEGNSLLHTVVRAYGLSISNATSRFFNKNTRFGHQKQDPNGWLRLLGECIAAGCDIQSIRFDRESNSRRTPFLEVIHGFLYPGSLRTEPAPPVIEAVMRIYLLVLAQSGIDILSYGQKEKELHDQDAVDKTFQYVFFPLGRKNTQWKVLSAVQATWNLIGFTYGPTPDDWRIWGSQPTDDFVGDFWCMIESPWERMPGAWPQ